METDKSTEETSMEVESTIIVDADTDTTESQQIGYVTEDIAAITYYPTVDLNCRISPDVNSKRVTTFSRNVTLTATKKSDTGWYFVSNGTYEGWCNGYYLSETKTVIETPKETQTESVDSSVSNTTDPVFDNTQFTDYEITLMAKCVWLEARGESYAGQVAVAEVIINRVTSTNFANTVEGVIWQPGQFTTASSMSRATPTQTQYNAVMDAINGNGVLNNPRCVYFSVGRSCGAYYTTIGRHVFGCE